jgi:hypothetical protein
MITFVFFASLRGSFFRAPGERFIEWRQRRDKFSRQYPRPFRKPRWAFANLARDSVVQAKLVANRPSQSARRNEEPCENRG